MPTGEAGVRQRNGVTAGALLAGAVGLLALPSAVLAFTAKFEPTSAKDVAGEAIEPLDAGTGRPGLARPLPIRSLAKGNLYPFTLAETPNRPDRSVTVAVRSIPVRAGHFGAPDESRFGNWRRGRATYCTDGVQPWRIARIQEFRPESCTAVKEEHRGYPGPWPLQHRSEQERRGIAFQPADRDGRSAVCRSRAAHFCWRQRRSGRCRRQLSRYQEPRCHCRCPLLAGTRASPTAADRRRTGQPGSLRRNAVPILIPLRIGNSRDMRQAGAQRVRIPRHVLLVLAREPGSAYPIRGRSNTPRRPQWLVPRS